MLVKLETDGTPVPDITRVIIADDIQFDLYRDFWEPDENYVYEPDVARAIVSFVRPGDVCIDAGASLGYHSILMARLAGETGEVLAFEVDPGYFQKLQDNIALNNLETIKAFPIALWSNVRAMAFNVIDLTEDNVRYAGLSSFVKYDWPPSHAIKVLTQPLDKLVDPQAKIRLLKIDCEGAEEHILRGAENLLKRGVDAVIVEFNYKIMPLAGTSDRAMRDYMAELGYDCFFLHKQGKQPPSFIPSELEIKVEGEGFHFNVLFARQDRLKDMWWIDA